MFFTFCFLFMLHERFFFHLSLPSVFFFFPDPDELSSVCGGVSPVPPVLSLSRSIKRRRTHAGCLKSPPTLPYGWWTGRCSNHAALSRQEEHASHLLLYPWHGFRLQAWGRQFAQRVLICPYIYKHVCKELHYYLSAKIEERRWVLVPVQSCSIRSTTQLWSLPCWLFGLYLPRWRHWSFDLFLSPLFLTPLLLTARQLSSPQTGLRVNIWKPNLYPSAFF